MWTRYFGGVLLGTGGLVRAYSGAVQAGLGESTVIEKHHGISLALTADYTAIGKLQYIAAENQLPVLDTEYTDKVIMHLLVPNDQVGRIQKVITEATSGRIKMEKEKELYESKVAFFTNITHEIRTPLNAIVGFSQLLNSDMPLEPEEKAEFIDLITKNSDLLLKLINDILDLSRIESGSMSFSYENLDLSKLMGDIFHTHQLMMPEGVELKIRVPHEPLIIRSDHFRLTQVCTNFINNAVKFTAKGYIEIGYELSVDGKSILISVKDTGKGIPDDKKEKVFERFQKLDEFAQGTGLGLAICQSIVHTFHGSISLESEVGVGSKFTISLPYTPGLELEERT